MTATQDEMIAELQRTVAELRRELIERGTALARRNSEYGERIEHQSATIDVLKTISASPDNAQPVFDLITRRARTMCDVPIAALFEFDEELVHLRSWEGHWVLDAKDEAEAYQRLFPMVPSRGSITCRAILDQRIIHVRDVAADPEVIGAVRAMGHKSQIAVPMMRGGKAVGAVALASLEPGGFSDTQVDLLKTFAEQAVIAITSAETYRALQSRTADLQESLEYQAATSDVLKVISRSTFDLQPVLDKLTETAAQLCDADFGLISTREGDDFRVAATHSAASEYDAFFRGRLLPAGRESVTGRAALEGQIVLVEDVAADPEYKLMESVTLGDLRTALGVPLLREGIVVGVIGLGRTQVRAFTPRQIELVSTFADQAVIAIENTRLLTEQQEALEQQTATAEVLQVINASPGNLQPVFDVILEKAHMLCGAAIGSLNILNGANRTAAATRGYPEQAEALGRQSLPLGDRLHPLFEGARFVQIPDIRARDLPPPTPLELALMQHSEARTRLVVPLRKEGVLFGTITAHRLEVRPFSDREIALLENFAAQAVIAMENARLLNEIRQRQEELRITFENMGDGVAMFDGTSRLVAWNRKFQEFFNVPDGLLAEHRTHAEYIRYLAQRGDYGADADAEDTVSQIAAMTGVRRTYERMRPDGRVIEIRNDPAAGGGFVLMFSDITERKRNEEAIRIARDAAEAAFRELKTAQAHLIQAEKMASLGQLTAGIAHEIKNPLNFVNNFAELSVVLLGELKDAIAPAEAALNPDQRDQVDDVVATLTSNLEKITEHGKRADGIVKAMLEHSRGASGERRVVDINALAEGALNLAYHGARAHDQSFNITLERDFGGGIAPIEVNPQDITRVLLNLFSNGFYAAKMRERYDAPSDFKATLKLTTQETSGGVEIRVRDNGTGIPVEIRDKLFQPFFTTKQTGEGTGLGLSITYDIVTKAHGGTITVESEVGAFSEFVFTLPRGMFTNEGSRA